MLFKLNYQLYYLTFFLSLQTLNYVFLGHYDENWDHQSLVGDEGFYGLSGRLASNRTSISDHNRGNHQVRNEFRSASSGRTRRMSTSYNCIPHSLVDRCIVNLKSILFLTVKKLVNW